MAASSALAVPEPQEFEYVEGMVLVQFAPGVTAAEREQLFEDLGAFDREHLPWIDFWAARISRRTTREAIDRWADSPIVRAIEPNGLIFANGPVPDDPEFVKQWHLRNLGEPVGSFGAGTAGADIAAPKAWCTAVGDPSVVVATLDTGVDYEHPDLIHSIFTNTGEIPDNGVDDDLNGKVDDVRGWDFDDHFNTGGNNDPMDTSGHGTLVAGVVAAAADGQGAVGVAPGVTILPIRVLTNTSTSPPSGTILQAVLGIHYAVEMGADLINCSFGSFQGSLLMRGAIEEAQSHEVILVCGAGNDANDNDLRAFFPASYPHENVVSVTATNPRDEFVSSFANWGVNSVDLAAPGIDIWGPVWIPGDPYERYGSSSGTSFAAPQVTGALALLQSFLPGLDHPTPRQVLMGSVRPQASLSGIVASAGRLDVHRMLLAVSTPDLVAPARILDLEVVDVGTHWVELEWTAPGDDDYTGTACCYEMWYDDNPILGRLDDAFRVRPPDPLPGGSTQRFRVEGLRANTEYWFSMRTQDEATGLAFPSNEPSTITLPASILVTPGPITLNVATGQTGTLPLTIRNPSPVPLTFEVSADQPWISLSQTMGTLAFGDSANIDVDWTASGLFGAVHVANLEILSNAVGATEITVPISLNVAAAAEILVAPLAVDLGTPFAGHPAQDQISVTNLGFRTLVVESITSAHPGLAASPTSFSLGPGGVRNVQVSLLAEAPGAVTEDLFFVSNSPFATGLSVRVTAQAVAPPVLDLSVASIVAVGTTGIPADPIPIVVRNLQTEGPDLDVALAVADAGVPGLPRGTPAWITLEPAAVSVPPGGSAEVLAMFDTASLDPGVFAAMIQVSTNDPARLQESVPVVFDLSGVAGFTFTATVGDFGEVPVGTFAERAFPVANAGNDTLFVEVVSGGAFVAGADLALAVGEESEVRIRYRPEDTTPEAVMLRLLTNDPARPLAVVPLTGQGTHADTWSGEVHLDRRLIVPVGTELRMDAGTTLDVQPPLAAGEPAPALEVRGRLTVAGVEGAPVRIGAASPGDWDGIVIHGNADLSHVEVTGARVGLEVAAGGSLDLLCGDLAANDVGIHYGGGSGTQGRVRGTRLANRLVNLRLDDGAGLQAGGTTADQAGWNVFVNGGDGAANVEASAPLLAPPLLTGNAWLSEPGGELLGLGSVRKIQDSFRGMNAEEVFFLPLLSALPENCEQPDRAPETPGPDVPARFDFARGIPNPVRAPFAVDFDLPAGFLGNVIVDVYDVRGALVREVVNRFSYAGRHKATWDLADDQGRAVATGVYFLRMETLEFVRSRKVLVLR